MMFRKPLVILSASILLILGCKQSPTEPVTPSGSTLFSVKLSPLDPPPGVKHLVLATIWIRTATDPVTVTGVHAHSNGASSHVVVTVSGFVSPVHLASHQETTFTVTLSTTEDIPCADEIAVDLGNEDQRAGDFGPTFNCFTGTWLF